LRACQVPDLTVRGLRPVIPRSSGAWTSAAGRRRAPACLQIPDGRIRA